MSTEIVRLKRQLAERDEKQTIRDILHKLPEMKLKNIRISSASKLPGSNEDFPIALFLVGM